MEIEFVDTRTNETVLKWSVPDKCSASNSEVLRHKYKMYNGYIFARHAFYNVLEAKVYLFTHQYPERDSFSDEEYFGRLCAIGQPWVRQLPFWHEMVRSV